MNLDREATRRLLPVRASAQILLTLLCLGAFEACTLSTPSPVRVNIPSDYLGINHAGGSRSAAEYSLLSMLGTTCSRIDFSWNVIEAQPGAYKFSGYDAIVNTALSNGVEILAILDYDVPWIHPDGQEHKYIPPDRMPDWLNFVGNVVDHYLGKLRAYEIWNEPNGVYWKGSIDEFASLTRQTAAVIRARDPSAVIVGGAFWLTSNDWARAMVADGAFQQVDAISFHPYSSTAETVAQISNNFIDYVRSLGFKGTFWITEVGFTTQGIYPWTIPQAEYPIQLAKTVTILSTAGVERLYWYKLTDKYLANQAPSGETLLTIGEAYFGVAYPDYSPKNGAYAYHVMSNSLQGSTYVPDLIENFSARNWIQVYPFLRTDGRLVVVAWSDLPARVEFSEAVTGTIADIDGPGQSRFSGQVIRLSYRPLVLLTDAAVDASHFLIYKAAF